MTAREESHTKFTVDDREISTAWSRMFDHLDRTERKLHQLNAAQRRTTKEAAGGFEEALQRVTGFQLGVEGAISLMQRLIALQEEHHRKQEQQSVPFAQQLRGAAVQQMTGSRNFQEQVAAIARATGTDPSVVLALRQQAVSSGVQDQDIAGAVAELIRLRQLTPGIGGEEADPGELTRSLTQWVKDSGLELTPQNLRRASNAFIAEWRGKDVQLGELPYLAKISPGLAGMGMTLEQQMAAFAATDGVQAAERATGLRNTFGFLQAALDPNEARKRAALAAIGATPEGVHVGPGEDVFGGLDHLAAALADESPENREIFFNQYFGTENKNFAMLAVNSRQRMRDALKEISAGEQTARNLAAIRASEPATQLERAEVERKLAQLEGNEGVERATRRVRAANLADQVPGPVGDISSELIDRHHGTLETLWNSLRLIPSIANPQVAAERGIQAFGNAAGGLAPRRRLAEAAGIDGESVRQFDTGMMGAARGVMMPAAEWGRMAAEAFGRFAKVLIEAPPGDVQPKAKKVQGLVKPQ